SEGEAAAGGEKKPVAGTLRYCEDITNQAAAGEFDPVIGRDGEIQQVIQILLRRRKNSPVLVGGAGVGKSAIVEGLAQAIIDGKVPKALDGVKIMSLDMGSLVAGAKYKGEFEERFKGLVGDVVKSGGKIVLFVDEIHSLASAGNTGGGMDAANLIKPALARGQIRLIGATTEEEYTKYLEKDKALDRRFERVKVMPPGFDDAVRIVKGVVPKYQEHHKISYTEDALVASVKLSLRYLSERNLPDVALDVIDEAASEFAVKEEFAKVKIPELTTQAGELEKMVTACEGKDPEKEPEPFKALEDAWDKFSREVDRVRDFWGNRLESVGSDEGGAA
ncbi:AAA family ATPase, partial [candidate division GN15 bacterium]|nr:AAA family ATPase [candidate division GN15 bacterium]